MNRVEESNATKNIYEEDNDASVLSVMFSKKSILLYTVLLGLTGLVYSQFNFLIPLNMEAAFGERGATIFGMLTSVNAITVIIGTPILTKVMVNVKDVHKLVIGIF